MTQQVSSLTPFSGGWEAHKNNRYIWIVTPQNYAHSHAFDEVALGLQGAWQELGGTLPITTKFNPEEKRSPIVYGANLLPPNFISLLPKDSVIVNLEQVSDDSIWMKSNYLQLMKTFPVVDYTPRNRDNLASKGITHAGLLEIGYSPCLTRIPKAPAKDIDVLFYGSMNQRRVDILAPLQKAGLKVGHLFNVYGSERDAAIARAKVVMNIHFYSSKVFEIVRVSYLLANRVCVLTEGNSEDPDINFFAGGMAVEPYERLIDRCKDLVSNEKERIDLENSGFEIMSNRSQVEMLKATFAQGETA